jgi:hypothetical protein
MNEPQHAAVRLRLHPRVRSILREYHIPTFTKDQIADRLYAEAWSQRCADRAQEVAVAAGNFREWAREAPAPVGGCRVQITSVFWQAAVLAATRRLAVLFRVFRLVNVQGASYAEAVARGASQDWEDDQVVSAAQNEEREAEDEAWYLGGRMPECRGSLADRLVAAHGLYFSLDGVQVSKRASDGHAVRPEQYAPYLLALCARPRIPESDREVLRRAAAQLYTARHLGSRHLMLPVASWGRLTVAVARTYQCLLQGRFATDFDRVIFYRDRSCPSATLACFRDVFLHTADV